MKTAGILGGFGPESTAKFQLEIVEIFRARKIKTRPPLLIWQTPIPLKIEKELVLKSKGVSKFLPFLIKGAKRLEKGGADFIVIPCNSLHILINELCRSVKLPTLSIVEETSSALGEKGLNKVGVIGTRVLIESQLHQKCLRSHGIQPILPSKKNQDLINQSINEILADNDADWVKKILLQITEEFLALDVKDILLACTDLRPFFPEFQRIKIHDTLQVLANATAKEILNEKRCS